MPEIRKWKTWKCNIYVNIWATKHYDTSQGHRLENWFGGLRVGWNHFWVDWVNSETF